MNAQQRHLWAVPSEEPIDPRRGLRIAAETNRVWAAIRNREPTWFLLDRVKQLETEPDESAAPE